MKKYLKLLWNAIKYPPYILLYLDTMRIITLNDKLFIKLKYRKEMGKKLNLKNPKTFNEKNQWLKLYNRDPKFTDIVDKYEVKKYVSNIIGEEYVIKTLGVYNKFEEIDFDSLPNKFVMKTTHDSGGVIVCKDKNGLDIEKSKIKIETSLKYNYFYAEREWPYKNVKPRIIIEEYLEDNIDKELRDYKFYCFDGYVHSLLLATNRQSETEELCFDYFDNRFNHLKLVNHWHSNAKEMPHKPDHFEKMVELASILSKGFPHIRVDFYEANGKIYFGELTFSDMGGHLIIHPDDWDLEWGNLIKLPGKEDEK